MLHNRKARITARRADAVQRARRVFGGGYGSLDSYEGYRIKRQGARCDCRIIESRNNNDKARTIVACSCSLPLAWTGCFQDDALILEESGRGLRLEST